MVTGLFRKRRKEKIKYDIELYDDNTYALFFELSIPKGWMEKVIEKIGKLRRQSIRIEQVDSFVATEGLGVLQSKIRKYVDLVVNEVRKELKGFKIHSAKVEDVVFIKANGYWRAKIRVVGVYST